MATLFDYIDWRGDLSFSQCEPCEVDSLILSQVCYLDLYRIVPASPTAKGLSFLAAAKRYVNAHKGEPNSLGAIIPPETVTITTKAARSARFGSLRLVAHVNVISEDEQKQFSATTFDLGNDSLFIAFRGTDDTIVGWKECFNMSFMSPIPAQTEAVEYVYHVAAAMPDKRLYLGGHSKGGNLAVYAAVKASPSVQDRIAAVYNLDGPGFTRDFIESEEYAKIKERIHTLVPQTSIVGMLLEHDESYEVVQSTQSGLLQHNGFSWEVMGNRFIHSDTVTKESKNIDAKLKQWLSEITPERRKEILDTLYEILDSTNIKTLTALSAEKLKLVKAWNTLDTESRTFIRRCVTLIAKNTKGNK